MRLVALVALACAVSGCTCRRGTDSARAVADEKTAKHWTTRTIASAQNQPFGIAVDDTYVFWTNKGKTRHGDGSLMKEPKSGGAPTVVLEHLYTPYAIALDADHVYVTEYDSNEKLETGAIVRAKKDGTDLERLVDHQPTPWAAAVFGETVYYTTLTGKSVLWVGRIGDDWYGTIAEYLGKPLGLAVDADWVYWSDADRGVVFRASHDVRTPTSSPPAPAVLAESLKKPAEIAIDDAYVYWAEYDDQSIGRAPKKGGPKEKITSGAFHPRSIAVDDRFVWFVAGKEGLVLRAPKTGGAPETIAAGQKFPYSIAVDARSVYWTNNDDGTVMAVDKE